MRAESDLHPLVNAHRKEPVALAEPHCVTAVRVLGFVARDVVERMPVRLARSCRGGKTP